MKRYKVHISQNQKELVLKIILIFVFISYAETLLVVTLFKYIPITEIFSSGRLFSQSVNLIPFADWNIDRIGMLRDIILNVILFCPFGFLLQMISNKRRIGKISVVIPAFISVIIELLQYCFSLGAADITDVISNVLGALIGATLYSVFRIIFQKNIEKANRRLLYFIGIIAVINFCL